MSNQLNLSFAAIAIVICASLLGCRTQPNWGPQGTIGAQRTKAVLHDPFPNNDLAPPIVGGRPLGYEQPKSEPVSLQNSPFARRGMQGGRFTPTYGF